jgi:hypothetical protein
MPTISRNGGNLEDFLDITSNGRMRPLSHRTSNSHGSGSRGERSPRKLSNDFVNNSSDSKR